MVTRVPGLAISGDTLDTPTHAPPDTLENVPVVHVMSREEGDGSGVNDGMHCNKHVPPDTVCPGQFDALIADEAASTG